MSLEYWKEIEYRGDLDLHHIPNSDTDAVVRWFLQQSRTEGRRLIRIAHGKGKSKKKKWVHQILADTPFVRDWKDDGYNWGATLIQLQLEE